MRCARCDSPIVVKSRGRLPEFCSTRCRVAAHRNRKRTPIPPALTRLARWARADGKRPVQVDGAPASSTNPATWTTFDEVQAGSGSGFGIMLGDGLGCFDLDHCVTPEGLTEEAASFLATIGSPIWVEKSMSGTGLHVFVYADEAPGYRRDGFEFYSRARFIAVTGDPFT